MMGRMLLWWCLLKSFWSRRRIRRSRLLFCMRRLLIVRGRGSLLGGGRLGSR